MFVPNLIRPLTSQSKLVLIGSSLWCGDKFDCLGNDAHREFLPGVAKRLTVTVGWQGAFQGGHGDLARSPGLDLLLGSLCTLHEIGDQLKDA